MDVNNCATKGWQGSGKHGRENIYCFWAYLNRHEQSVSRSIISKALPVRVQLELKWGLYYWELKEGGSLFSSGKFADLCPGVTWNTKLVNDKLGYLAVEISKQTCRCGIVSSCCLYSKMQEECVRLRKNMKKTPGLDDLGSSQSIKTKNYALERKLKICLEKFLPVP